MCGNSVVIHFNPSVESMSFTDLYIYDTHTSYFMQQKCKKSLAKWLYHQYSLGWLFGQAKLIKVGRGTLRQTWRRFRLSNRLGMCLFFIYLSFNLSRRRNAGWYFPRLFIFTDQFRYTHTHTHTPKSRNLSAALNCWETIFLSWPAFNDWRMGCHG